MKSCKYHYPTPVGTICIEADETAVLALYLKEADNTAECMENTIIRKTHQELLEYFAGKRKKFTVPVNAKGTAFQKAVWNVLLDIPYGETRSYKEIAKAVGNPKACRAVGGANHQNPIMILIPCHRVIGANGSLTGYAGGLSVKEKLLALERRVKCDITA